MENKPKIIVVLGPTATGKSDLAVALAKEFNGEVISADSRQVYKGLDIGSGKITKKEMQRVPHYLLDVVSPKSTFTVAHFKKQSEKIIKDIITRGKTPIICGGTGFYIQSLVDGIVLPEVKPNKELRKKLESKTSEELFAILLKLDHNRATTIDPSNPVRLIRAIEIARALGNVPEIKAQPKYQSIQIGLDWTDKVLKERIQKRLFARIKKGMIREVSKLHEAGISWKKLESFGLEYRYIALLLQQKITKEEMASLLETEIWHYAKRQRTWFKKDTRIKWFKPTQLGAIKKEAKRFLK